MTRTAATRALRIAAAILPIVIAAGAVSLRAAGPTRKCAEGDRVALRTLSWVQVEQFIGRQTGKVVLVDVWTTTCPVCREHFPDFVALHKKLSSRGLVCVSLNCDYDGVPGKPPQHYAPRVLEFLNEQDARCTNILLSDPLIDFLDAAGIGSTPTYLLYNRQGKLVRRFDGSEEEFTIAEMAQAVESAMSAGGNARQTADPD